MTKEELLQKGVSEEVADEIIQAMTVQEDEDSLSALQKALDEVPENMELLEKAEDEEEEDEEKDEYSEKDMKRYMKAKGKAACQKMMKELGFASEKMSKAVEDIDADADGAIVEMAVSYTHLTLPTN